MRKQAISSLICIVVVFIIGAAALADTIRLKDGTVLKGKVISYSQGKFTVIVYIGGSSSQHVIGIDEVESVDFSAADATTSGRGEGSAGGAESADTGTSQNQRSSSTLPIGSAGGSQASREPVNSPQANDLPPDEGTLAVARVIAEKTVSIAAAADWTSTEIRVQRGQRITISASGEVDLGGGRRCGPDGINAADNRKLIPNRSTGALIAVVSDDNDDFVYIGRSGEFTSPHNGILFLSVNEGNLKDNNGAFVARVKVLSNKLGGQ